ncbi:MAG: hypothetical protein CMQ19_08675 [Gammaproteobacteria bacterium]|nr:hypothetical protein [Gammaproteobacteria bacterium]
MVRGQPNRSSHVRITQITARCPGVWLQARTNPSPAGAAVMHKDIRRMLLLAQCQRMSVEPVGFAFTVGRFLRLNSPDT